MKKIVPDPPLIQIDHCLDIELERVRERLANHPDSPTLLHSLGSARQCILCRSSRYQR